MDKLVSGPPPSTTFGTAGSPLIVDSTWGALRASIRPLEYNAPGFQGGHYRIAQKTGLTTGIASGGVFYSTRWAPGPSGLYVLKRLQVAAQVTTAFTGAQQIDIDCIRATLFTAADTGGTALTPLVGNKKRSIMAVSQCADKRIATTAALGAGTRTLDGQPFGMGPVIASAANTALQTASFIDLYKEDEQAEHPEVFGNNEGYLVRVVTAQGAAGVVVFYVIEDWAEVPGL